MPFKISWLKTLLLLVSATFIVSCSENETAQVKTPSVETEAIVLDVYKSPTCGCCKDWISHVDDNGFQSNVHNENDVSVIKGKMGIAPRYRSCHTAISAKGFIFEGHVPAKYMQQFLKQTHGEDVIGLSVPAMPLGSPGMEVGDRFQPYKVLLLKKDGSYEIYASVNSYEEQF